MEEIEQYLSVDLSKSGIATLAKLSPVSENIIRNLNLTEQKKILLHFLELWNELVTAKEVLSQKRFLIWRKCFEVLTYTIATLMPIYLANTQYDEKELNKICHAITRKHHKQKKKTKSKTQGDQVIYQAISHIYHAIILVLTDRLENYGKLLASTLEDAALYYLFLGFYSTFHNKPRRLQNIAHQMFQSLFQIAGGIYKIIGDKMRSANIHVIPGFFPKEFDLISKRDESIIKKYGRKNIERIFERQIAFIMQAFGFFVASTRAFERTVDMVCVSGVQGVQLTIMVEAKTSRKPYSLPTKDSRALSDYVKDIKSSLKTLPKLKFLLIIGPSPAKTLKQKLKKLEFDIGIPVRFICASSLVELWGQFPGHLQLDIFEKELLTSDMIVDSSFVQSLVKHYKQECKAHEDFIRSLLSIRDAI